MTKHSAPDYKTAIIARAREQGLQITALREQVLDIVLRQEGVIKAYTVLAQMQQQSNGVVAPPTAYRALDFWAEHGVLHKVAAMPATIATTTATAATSGNTTTAPSFWCVPSAATPMSKPSPANGRRCAPAWPQAGLN